MTEQRKHEIYLVAGIGGGAVILLLALSHASHGNSRLHQPGNTPSTPHPVTRNPASPNPGDAQLAESIVAARANALSLYDQSATAEMAAAAQRSLGIHETNAQVAINSNTNATQLKEVGLQTAAQQAISQIEAAAQEQIAAGQQAEQQALINMEKALQGTAISDQFQLGQQQINAQQNIANTSSNNSLWGSIIGGLTSLFSFL